jgi:hypothetical protein
MTRQTIGKSKRWCQSTFLKDQSIGLKALIIRAENLPISTYPEFLHTLEGHPAKHRRFTV